MESLYECLGVSRDASPADIKKAWHKKALTEHPDKGGDTEAFQKLQRAYNILSDPEKRATYDATGHCDDGPDSGPGHGSGPGCIDISQIFSMFGNGIGVPGGIPFPMFGGGGGRGESAKSPRGPNKIHEIGVSLHDLYHGASFPLRIKRDILCVGCKGKGGSKYETCAACGGRGMRMKQMQMGPMLAMTTEPCGLCNQTGQRVTNKCDDCAGRCVSESMTALEVVIEPGMQEGDRIVFPGKCSESPAFETPGDILLIIRPASTDSDEWIRRGEELGYEIHLSLAESLLGWERHIDNHPSGKPLHIVWSNGMVREGEVLRIPTWGMPKRGEAEKKGDLRLICRIKGDQGAWSEEQRCALKSVWPDWKEPVLMDYSISPQTSS